MDLACLGWRHLAGSWEDVGLATQFIPSSFGHAPWNPAEKVNSGYKAWEFQLYLVGLGPSLLRHILLGNTGWIIVNTSQAFASCSSGLSLKTISKKDINSSVNLYKSSSSCIISVGLNRFTLSDRAFTYWHILPRKQSTSVHSPVILNGPLRQQSAILAKKSVCIVTRMPI